MDVENIGVNVADTKLINRAGFMLGMVEIFAVAVGNGSHSSHDPEHHRRK